MRLNQFLVKAKTNTYASIGESREKTLIDGSKELIYEENNFKYRDRYFGFNPFIGQEVIFKDKKIIWSMNYYGRIFSDIITPEKIYEFLRKAMKLVKEDRPFRGSHKFKEGDFEYYDESQGSIDEFNGAERILFKGKEVYILDYNGGLVKDR